MARWNLIAAVLIARVGWGVVVISRDGIWRGWWWMEMGCLVSHRRHKAIHVHHKHQILGSPLETINIRKESHPPDRRLTRSLARSCFLAARAVAFSLSFSSCALASFSLCIERSASTSDFIIGYTVPFPPLFSSSSTPLILTASSLTRIHYPLQTLANK
jgi:hypothetical protein